MNSQNEKTATDAKVPGSRKYSFGNYHFLTRSTDSITRLTSSLARLRVSKRIIPLLFIMAAIACERKFPDDPYMERARDARDGIIEVHRHPKEVVENFPQN